MLKAIHAQEDLEAARVKVTQIADKLVVMKLGKAAELVRSGAQETLAYYGFPNEHWRRIRTNNPMERIMREIRRRTRVVGSFPDGESALMLVAARLRHVSGSKWGSRRYLDMDHLYAPCDRASQLPPLWAGNVTPPGGRVHVAGRAVSSWAWGLPACAA